MLMASWNLDARVGKLFCADWRRDAPVKADRNGPQQEQAAIKSEYGFCPTLMSYPVFRNARLKSGLRKAACKIGRILSEIIQCNAPGRSLLVIINPANTRPGAFTFRTPDSNLATQDLFLPRS